MKEKRRLILNYVSLLSSLVVLFNANPLIRLALIKTVRRINSTISQKKKIINYLSLTTVIFGSFYFILPDDFGKWLDQLLVLLLFTSTKLQWKEWKSYTGFISSNIKLVRFIKALCVSVGLSLKAKNFSNKFAFSKYIPHYFRLFKRNHIILLLSLFPLTKIGTSILKDKKDIFELIISLFVSTELMQRTSDNNVWREFMMVFNTIYYYKYLTIPNFLSNYSFKILLEALYTSLVVKPLRKNKKLYKRLQCLIIAVVLINLVQHNQDDDNYFNRVQRWVLESINNGALIRTADSMKHHDLQPKFIQNSQKDAETRRKARRTSSINKLDPTKVKIYGNDYDLRIYK